MDTEIRPSAGRELGTYSPGGIFLENDSFYWLTYARRIADAETWRVRETKADNTPYGREVHWSQSVSWLLVFLATIRQMATGEGIRAALEVSAVWMNPLLQGLLIAALGHALFRRLGAIPAGFFALYAAASSNIGFAFHALRPDHQGLQLLFALLTVAGLVLAGCGWVNRQATRTEPSLAAALDLPDFPTSKKWFLLSGLAAGCGLWVSAAMQSILLLLIFLSALLVVFFAAPSEGKTEVRPELWRYWGRVCGLTSFAFYLLEYFPNHLGLRLEVNHPFYSLLAVSMGEAVCQLQHFRHARGGRPALAWGVILTALVFALPALLLFGPPQWHALRDPHMFRLHQFIEEFQSFPRTVGPGYLGQYFRDFGVLPAFYLAAFACLFLSQRARPALAFALLVALGALGLAWLQVRWLGLADALNILLAALAGACLWPRLSRVWSARRRLWLSTLLVGLLALQPILFMVGFHRYIQPILAGTTIPQNFLYPLMAKRIALAFRDLAGPGARVLASPSLAPALQYFADASVVSSLYWENRPGLDASLAFFTDTDGATAQRIARERGLGYIVLLPENQMAGQLSVIQFGHVDHDILLRMLYSRLAGGLDVPAWTVTDSATRAADSRTYRFGDKSLTARCRIYRIQLP